MDRGQDPVAFANGPGTPRPEGWLEFDVAYPERLSRLLIFVKWLLVIPHLFVLYVLGFVAGLVTFIAWFAILFTGRFPEGLWNFFMMYQRWSTRVSVYTALMRDEYPPFGDEPYPVRFEMTYPTRLSRLLIFVKWLLIIPHIVVLWLVSIAALFVGIIAWFAILITGSYPRGLFNFSVGVLRWGLRVNLYLSLTTDVYPPFSLE
jgi:hypothetical protein